MNKREYKETVLDKRDRSLQKDSTIAVALKSRKVARQLRPQAQTTRDLGKAIEARWNIALGEDEKGKSVQYQPRECWVQTSQQKTGIRRSELTYAFTPELDFWYFGTIAPEKCSSCPSLAL
jgi:hypothetical protein